MDDASRFHVVFGSGGSKAILGGAGAILAFEVAGIRDWLSIGSCSGGSMPALFLASGKPTREILRTVVDTDFAQLLRAKRSLLWRLAALLFKYRNEVTRPEHGVYSAQPMADFVTAQIGSWPQRFWTVCSGRKADYILTKSAVHLEIDGVRQQTQLPALALGRAINATCAVPGFIDGVRFAGDVLHDGALSVHGECPASVATRYFGSLPEKVLAFDMEPEPIKQRGWLRMAWRAACMNTCGSFDANHLQESDGYLLIRPNITGFHGLQFNLTRCQKWEAICAGFDATVNTLLRHNLVPGDRRDRLVALAARLQETRADKQSRLSTATRVELVLIAHDLLVARRSQQ